MLRHTKNDHVPVPGRQEHAPGRPMHRGVHGRGRQSKEAGVEACCVLSRSGGVDHRITRQPLGLRVAVVALEPNRHAVPLAQGGRYIAEKAKGNPIGREELMSRAGRFSGDAVFARDDASRALEQRHVVPSARPYWLNIFTSIASRSRDLSRNEDVRALNRKLMRGGDSTLSDWEVDLIERTIVENMDALQDPLTDKEIERVFKGIDAFRAGLPEPPRANPRRARNACFESLFDQAVESIKAGDRDSFEDRATRWVYSLYGSEEAGEQAIAEAIEHEGNRFDALRVMVFG